MNDTSKDAASEALHREELQNYYNLLCGTIDQVLDDIAPVPDRLSALNCADIDYGTHIRPIVAAQKTLEMLTDDLAQGSAQDQYRTGRSAA